MTLQRARLHEAEGKGAELTLPVDLTPFQMQKKQTSQTSRRQRARSHFSAPGSSIPEDRLRTCRLQANRAPSQTGWPGAGRAAPGFQEAAAQPGSKLRNPAGLGKSQVTPVSQSPGEASQQGGPGLLSQANLGSIQPGLGRVRVNP